MPFLLQILTGFQTLANVLMTFIFVQNVVRIIKNDLPSTCIFEKSFDDKLQNNFACMAPEAGLYYWRPTYSYSGSTQAIDSYIATYGFLS